MFCTPKNNGEHDFSVTFKWRYTPNTPTRPSQLQWVGYKRERERGTCSTVAVVSHSLAAFGTNFGGRRLSVVSLSSFEVNANALLTAHGAVSVPLPSLSVLAKWG